MGYKSENNRYLWHTLFDPHSHHKHGWRKNSTRQEAAHIVPHNTTHTTTNHMGFLRWVATTTNHMGTCLCLHSATTIIERFDKSLIHSLSHSLTHSLNHSPQALANFLTSLTHPLTHSLTHPPAHSLPPSSYLPHSHTVIGTQQKASAL